MENTADNNCSNAVYENALKLQKIKLNAKL